ncbi:MAG: ATP-binding cassette domain-containing protein [Mycoplasmoidaceae bacterium]
MNKIKERDILLVWLENTFYELHKNNLDYDHQLHIKQTDNFHELKEKCNFLGINLIQIKKDNLFSEANKNLICFIEIDYKKQYCILKIIGNKYFITTNDNKYKFTEKEFLELNIQKIWSYQKGKINYQFLELKIDIKKYKFKYTWIVVLMNVGLFLIMIINNLYLKIILQNIIPNNAMLDLIFISFFFLLLFTLNIFVSSFLTFYKHKNFHKIIIKYFNYFLNNSMIKNEKFINENSQENIILNFKSIAPLIQKKIYAVPDFISNCFILLNTIIFISIISYVYLLISLISILFYLIVFILKNWHIKNIGNKNNYYETKIENKLYKFIYRIKNEWNYKILNEEKNKIIYETENFQNFTYENLKIKEKISLIEKMGNKIIFFIFTVISVFFIVNGVNEYFSVGLMIYVFTLINIISDSSNAIFDFLANLSFYKMHENKVNNFLKNIIKENKGIDLEEKITSIKVQNLSVKYNDKYIFKNLNKKLENDLIIFGKSGVGKTTLLRKILPNNNCREIVINGIATNLYNYESLKRKIIYLYSENNLIDIDINKLIHFNVDMKMQMIEFLKVNNLFEIISKKDVSMGERQIINFLSIIHEKSKIILLDEPLSHVDSKTKKKIIKTFKHYLISNNFVIWVSHDKAIIKYFKNKWEIKDEQKSKNNNIN